MTLGTQQSRPSLLNRRRVLGAMAAAPLAAMLLANGIAVGAVEPPTPPPGLPNALALEKVAGTVTNVSGGTLTVRQADGSTATVTTSDTTGAMLQKAIEVSDLKVGDVIGVTGDKTSDTAYTANNIMHLSGVKGLPSGTTRIAIGTPGAKVTVVNGTPPAGFPSTPVTVSNASGYVHYAPNGTPPPDDGKERVFFISGGPDDAEGKPGVIGEITAISGTTLTVKTPDNQSVTVSTNANTTILTNQEGKVSNIAVGDTVTAFGEKNGATLTSRSITIRHSG
jgi:hypothetical protein